MNEYKPLSQIVTNCLKIGFNTMEEDLIGNGVKPLNHKPKINDTIPMTFTIPIEVSDMLDYYSKWFKWKKSHLVMISIHYKLIDKLNQQLEDEIEELMESLEV